MKKISKKRKITGIVTVCVNSSFNNTIITACESSGNVVAWASSGLVGFKNTKESTPFAAQSAAENLIGKLKGMGAKEIKLSLKGLGSGRESVIKVFGSAFTLMELIERTPIAYNGVRQPKRRRS